MQMWLPIEKEGQRNMKVSLKRFAQLSEADVRDFRESTQYDISEGENVKDLIIRLGLPQDEIKVIFLHNKKVGLGTVLRDGHQLGLSPPVAGM